MTVPKHELMLDGRNGEQTTMVLGLHAYPT